jgi:hypothetical protein
MRKLLIPIIALLILMATFSAYGQNVKIIGKDFWVTDEELRPISFGLCSWTDEESPCQLGAFLNISLFNLWDNHLRLGTGFAISTPDEGTADFVKVDLRLIGPTVTTLLFDHLELGFYVTPFWNLYDGGVDDPYGVMVGYAFGF